MIFEYEPQLLANNIANLVSDQGAQPLLHPMRRVHDQFLLISNADHFAFQTVWHDLPADLGKGRSIDQSFPETVRHVFATLHRMFKSAVIDEVIETNPVMVEKGVLPKNVDKDPMWRAGAVFDRNELVALISDARIPMQRRVLYALKGLGALRHGEGAGVRWLNYVTTTEPLGKLVIARSYEKERTKTHVSREVPVHPVLASILATWRTIGWKATFGRDPKPDDLIVPRADGTVWEAHDADDYFKVDLETLGLRNRRGHDLRRTFITLTQVDGGRRDSAEGDHARRIGGHHQPLHLVSVAGVVRRGCEAFDHASSVNDRGRGERKRATCVGTCTSGSWYTSCVQVLRLS